MQNVETIVQNPPKKDELLIELNSYFSELKAAVTFDQFNTVIKQITHFFEQLATQYSLASFRFYGRTSNPELKAILDSYQEAYTYLSGIESEINRYIGSSPYLDKLKPIYGENQFIKWKNAQFSITSKAEKLHDEIEQINTKVVGFTSQAKAVWDNVEIPFNHLNKYTKDADRNIRKKASDLIALHYTTHEDFYYDHFLMIIQLRNEFAVELGFQDFSEYSIKLYNRIGYDYSDLKKYRNSVALNFRKIFELSNQLKKKNLKIDQETYYDRVLFADGPAKLLSSTIQENIDKYKSVLDQLNPDWKQLYIDMLGNQVIDYESRPDKAFTGFANYFHDIKTPILFLLVQNNFDDIRVLTHEYGHTLQLQLAYADRPYSSNYSFSLDCVEIFSHSMEMLSLPYVNTFFGEDAAKYKLENFISHLSQVVTTAIGDEFQEIIYKKKNLTKEFIQTTYKNLRKKYLGDYVDTFGNPYIENGNSWLDIPHYFASPFYLIDYSLAIINALKIYQIYLKDKSKAMAIWEKLAVNIGDLNYKTIKSFSFELINPFDENEVKLIAEFAFEELSKMMAEFEN